MKNLRLQLLISHLLLVLMMGVVMVGGIASVLHLGHSIDRIMKDNYKSVIAAQNMKEALERQDSAATFFLAGQVDRARAQDTKNSALFDSAFQVEANNITENGEYDAVQDINHLYYSHYRRSINRLMNDNKQMSPAAARAFYFATLEPTFERLKNRAQDVLVMNQSAIEKRDSTAKNEARTTAILGIIVSIASFILALGFALRMIRTAMAPLLTLARQAEEIGAGHLNQRIELNRNDEIGALATSFNGMIENLRQARKLAIDRLHRAERMSDAAVDSLYDPVVITDANGLVVHLNRAAEGLFGAAHSAVGIRVDRVVREERIASAVNQAIHKEQTSADEGEAAFLPFEVGGSQRIYRLRATPMLDDEGTLLGAVAVLEDVTHLCELDRLKTEFVSVASHELRTPVTSLLLSVQLMQEGAVGELTEDQREVVNAQREDLDRLERMMRDLLDITRLEAGVVPPRFEMISPGELLKSAMQSIKPQAESKHIKLLCCDAHDLPCIRADRGQILRVLLNLLNNAVRHTPAGGEIRMSASSTPACVEFEVADTGTGIPEDYLPRIFDRFVQVPGATRGGAGLGLSLAQTIVHAHGGVISAQSELDKGSAFIFSIPVGEGA